MPTPPTHRTPQVARIDWAHYCTALMGSVPPQPTISGHLHKACCSTHRGWRCPTRKGSKVEGEVMNMASFKDVLFSRMAKHKCGHPVERGQSWSYTTTDVGVQTNQ